MKTGSAELPNRKLPQPRNLHCRIASASAAPCNELDRVDAPIPGLGSMHHAVMHPELRGKVTLGQTGLFTHAPQKRAQRAVSGLVLRLSCHRSRTLGRADLAAIFAARSSSLSPQDKRRVAQARSLSPDPGDQRGGRTDPLPSDVPAAILAAASPRTGQGA